MLEVVICDDDKEDLDKATLMLDKILSEYQVQYQIRSFLSANELLNSNDKIDIGILDISMEELGGITLGRKLKEKNHDIKIIYITSYEEYMAQAINKVHAFSFLCKPINEEEMKTQIMEILGQEKYPEIEKEFEILDESGTKAGCVCLKLNEILYFEYIKRSRKAAIIMEDCRYECECTFENLVEELFSFLCKPINEEEMKTQIMEILGQEKYPEIEKEFEILDESGTKAGCVCLKLNEILYFEYIKRSRKAAIIMEDCRYECECTFENLVEELHPYDFAVNHRGCLINVRHIEKIQGFHIYLDNGKELSLAQKRSSDFREEMNKFLQKTQRRE